MLEGRNLLPIVPGPPVSSCPGDSGSCADLRRVVDALDARNQALRRSNEELRLVLDHVGEGLLTLRWDGTMAMDRSAIVESWLGPPPPGKPFWDYLAQVDPATGALFRMSWSQVAADVLPVELALDQLPQRLHTRARMLAMRYQPIVTEGALDRVLVVISDVTSEIEKTRLEAEGRMLIGLCERILQSRATVLEFLEEANELVRLVTGPTVGPALRRHVHTLKGICGMYGVTTIAELCHQIEERLFEDQGLCGEDREALTAAWRRLSARLLPLFGSIDTRRVEIDDAEYAALIEGLRSDRPRHQLLRMVHGFRLQPMQARLSTFADQARDLARRLGRASLRVQVDAGGLRHQAERWARFFAAFTHVVRNAVDHGVETTEERQAAGKPPEATLVMRGYVQGDYFLLEVGDDGRGIDWERLRARAQQSGLPAASRAELIAALFKDGISTRETPTETSGRGVGLAAVREACLALGGQVRLASEPGRGTTFQFRFPIDALGGEEAVIRAAAPSPSRGPRSQAAGGGPVLGGQAP